MDAILIDTHAERGLIGTMLENVQPREVDPTWIVSDGARILYLTADRLMRERRLHSPDDYGCAGGCWRTAKANAELIAFEIDRAAIWPGIDGPRWELTQCMDAATLPWLSDFYVDRIKMAATRRLLLDRANELRTRALHPAPLDASTCAMAA
ncbi:hypothetical protein Pan44_26970 [Caulifigura coniformis]|uniref:Uncharacterized protein n=1 Tax=Caulifigura coniformis TaxID=2527983 RepID=A0A517SEV6_9PLAN|nr:hypothetical protein [Caulifigura coniformis]QDT54662.1 hypothetical protein Pan44_26970 [Caulifigura coniformis]